MWLYTKPTKSNFYQDLLFDWVCLVLLKLSLKRANVKDFIAKETRVLLPEVRSTLSSSNVKMWYRETPASVVKFPAHPLHPQPLIPITALHFSSSFISPVQLFAALRKKIRVKNNCQGFRFVLCWRFIFNLDRVSDLVYAAASQELHWHSKAA